MPYTTFDNNSPVSCIELPDLPRKLAEVEASP
jgi:hypothetical protein